MTADVNTLPSIVQGLSSSIGSLPPQLSSVNLTLVSTLLATLSDDLGPIAPTVAENLNQQVLNDSAQLSAQVSTLGNIVSTISSKSLAKSSPTDFASLVRIFGERHTIWSFHSPDLPAIVILFGLAISLKLICAFALNKSAINRTRRNFAEQNKGIEVNDEVARSILRRPLVTACGRLLNLCIALTVLSLQLSSWHTFIVSRTAEPIRYDEIARLYLAIKILMVGYGSDLLFSDGPAKLYFHHFFTFVLLFVGLVTAAETHNPKFFRLANWLLLQGTALPTEFFAMWLYQSRRYLKTQGRDYRPALQRKLLIGSFYFFRFSSIATYFQKAIPAAVSLYWLNQMWDEMLTNRWGVTWLVLCTVTLSALSVLQLIIYDSVHPLCNHMRFQLYGGPVPSRHGPIARSVKAYFARRRETASTGYVRLSEKNSYDEKRPSAVTWSSDETTAPSTPSLDAKFDNFADPPMPVPSVAEIASVPPLSSLIDVSG